MIEMPPAVIYPTNPPQWDRVMWCGCGHRENRGRVRGKTADDSLMDQWKAAQKNWTEC